MCKGGALRTLCLCSPTEMVDELPLKGTMPTPLDKLGYPAKCCYCCSQKFATIVICVLSFTWATYDVQNADQTISSILTKGETAFTYAKTLYLLAGMCFIVACGCLMLGLIVKKRIPINIFVWYAFGYNCMSMALIILGASLNIWNSGQITKKQTFKIVFGVIWSFLYFFFLTIVNSYKLILWYKELGVS